MQANPGEILTLTFRHEFIVTCYFACAGCAIVWWDWLVTFDEEVTHIWPTKWTGIKVIFLVNRYMNLLLQPTLVTQLAGLWPTTAFSVCRVYSITYGILVFLSLASIHALVVVRAWVIWERRPWVTSVLVATYIAYGLTCLSLMLYSYLTARNDYMVNVDGICVLLTDSKSSFMWITNLSLEYLCFGLIIGNLWLHRRGTEPAFRQLSPIRRKIYVTAVLFVLYTSLTYTVDIILWTKYAQRPYNLLAVTFMYCLTNVAGQRFVLDLRQLNLDRIPLSQLPTRNLSEVSLPENFENQGSMPLT